MPDFGALHYFCFLTVWLSFKMPKFTKILSTLRRAGWRFGHSVPRAVQPCAGGVAGEGPFEHLLPGGGPTLWKISGVTHPSFVNILPSWMWVSCALLWGSCIWRGRGWGFCIALRAAPAAPGSSRSWCSVLFWVKNLITCIWRTKCALLFSESLDGDP